MSGVSSRSWMAAAVLGLAASVMALLMDAHGLLVTYLATIVTIASVAVGATAVLMISYLVRGSWTEGLHLPLAAAALATPLAGLLFVPVLVGLPWIYPWAHAAAGEPGSFKAVYLTPWFFIARTLLYFVIWTTLALWVRGAWAHPRRMVVSASAGLVVYALTASLAGIDWIESLTPDFHSSIYGLMFLTFQVLAGYAFALTVGLWRPAAPTFRYGAILVSALLMWAYNHAMQYIIIWSGNIPEEAVWYLRRESGIWGVAFWALITLQFVVPFLAMLSGRVRNGRPTLLAIALATLALRFLEAYVLALPGTVVAGAVLALAVGGTLLVGGALSWLAFTFIFRRLADSAHDRRPLPERFDSAGSPLPATRP